MPLQPLIWEASELIDDTGTPGGAVQFYTEEAQQLFIQSNVLLSSYMRTPASVWESPGTPTIVDNTRTYEELAVDHPANGILYGSAIVGATDPGLYYFNYLYSADISDHIVKGDVKPQADNPLLSCGITVDNIDRIYFEGDAALFAAGNVIDLYEGYGSNPTWLPMWGRFSLDQFSYKKTQAAHSGSGRSIIPKYLKDSTYGENTSWSGQLATVIYNIIIQFAGDIIIDPNTALVIQSNTTAVSKSFKRSDKVLQTLQKWLYDSFSIFMRTNRSGQLIIGDKAFIRSVDPNYRHNLTEIEDIITLSTIRNDDAAFAKVCVYDDENSAAYADIVPLAGLVPPAGKIFYVKMPPGSDDTTYAALATKIARTMDGSGLVEKYRLFLDADIKDHDVIALYDEDLDEYLDRGAITTVVHTIGRAGFFTEIIIDSAGVIEDQTGGVVDSDVTIIKGANRDRRIIDVIDQTSEIYTQSSSGDGLIALAQHAAQNPTNLITHGLQIDANHYLLYDDDGNGSATIKIVAGDSDKLGGELPSYYAIASDNIMFTPLGGLAVLMVNKTGAASVKGMVMAVDTTDYGVVAVPKNTVMPYGVMYSDGVANNGDVWVVISGFAETLLEDNMAATAGYWAGVSTDQDGRIEVDTEPQSTFKHDAEVGHVITSETAGTDKTCIVGLHFR